MKSKLEKDHHLDRLLLEAVNQSPIIFTSEDLEIQCIGDLYSVYYRGENSRLKFKLANGLLNVHKVLALANGVLEYTNLFNDAAKAVLDDHKSKNSVADEDEDR